VNWVRSSYSNYLVYCIRFWILNNSTLNCFFGKKLQIWMWSVHIIWCCKWNVWKIFSKVLYETYYEKNSGVFYGQVLTNFSFSEFWITDFHHKNSWNFAMLIPIRIFVNLLWRISVTQNSEKLCQQNIPDFFFRGICFL
jgi:hypothetical protein